MLIVPEGMNLTATHINYYHICHRKLWLFSNGITLEHTSDLVTEGKLIGENSYSQRAEKYTEIEIGGSKIDFYDAKNRVIHEIKKSGSMEDAHEWQVKYYIWLLEQHNVNEVTGIIEYPKLRQTKSVSFSDNDRIYLQFCMEQIRSIMQNPVCPPLLNSSICKRCSYFEFCYSSE